MPDDTSPNPPAPVEPPLAGEWLFKAGAEVFGPVPGAALVEMIQDGRVARGTAVCGGDGAWRTLAEVPAALVHLARAEARSRVEEELRHARRQALLRRAGVAAVTLALVAGASWLVATRASRSHSELLDDLGPGVELGGPVRVGRGSGLATDEIEVPALPPAGGARAGAGARPASSGTARAASTPGAPRGAPARAGEAAAAPGAASGGELVAAQYDVRGIEQAVARQRTSLAPCLRDEARRSPEFAGEIPIEFAVGNDGKVAALWVGDPRFKSGPLRDCLLRQLQGWSFEPFPGQRPVVALSFRIGQR